MAAISIKELVTKLNNFVMTDTDIDKEAMIADAWVCNGNNKEYPEGTLVFRTINSNATEDLLHDTEHQLIIYPNRVTKLN